MGLELSIWPVTITNADTALQREREKARDNYGNSKRRHGAKDKRHCSFSFA